MNASGFPLKTAGMTGREGGNDRRGRRECLPPTLAPDGNNRGTEGETGRPVPYGCNRRLAPDIRNRGTTSGKGVRV